MSNCNIETTLKIRETENEKLYQRNIPSEPLQPYISVRPVMTKYSYLPIVDPRKELSVGMIQQPTYNVNNVFNPGNTQSPWSGFATNINTESELKNQFYALQKCSQSVYVPNSNSDLYKVKIGSSNQMSSHSLLFAETQFEKFNPNPDPNILGSSIFYNSTRSQVKELSDLTPKC